MFQTVVNFFTKIKERIGPLWWYSILLFIGQRAGEIINLYIGMFLVPKYVPQKELGAVLPLQQMVSFIGLPLVILSIPIMKFLNVYAERGEFGKVKAMLRDTLCGMLILAGIVFLLAEFVLPLFFVRIRIVSGALTLLIIACTISSSLGAVFVNALNGLKLFPSIIAQTFLGAPARLGAMYAALPFRPLSGYFVGQCAQPITSIVFSVWALRKHLWNKVQATAYFREDRRAILRYTIPLIPLSISSILITTVTSLVIRHNLTDFESAGYYIISRFSEISSYIGTSFAVFLFPMVASGSIEDRKSRKMLDQSMLAAGIAGILVAFVLFLAGGWILGLTDLWRPYRHLTPQMGILAIYFTIAAMSGCFYAYETAQSRFSFLWYTLPPGILGSTLLYCWTGIDFFTGILPHSFIDWMKSFNPCRLSFIVWYMLCMNLTSMTGIMIVLWLRRCGRRQTSPSENLKD